MAYLSREKALNLITAKRVNFSAWRNPLFASHKELIDFALKALSCSAKNPIFASSHTGRRVQNARSISLKDPPGQFRSAAGAKCHFPHERVWTRAEGTRPLLQLSDDRKAGAPDGVPRDTRVAPVAYLASVSCDRCAASLSRWIRRRRREREKRNEGRK